MSAHLIPHSFRIFNGDRHWSAPHLNRCADAIDSGVRARPDRHAPQHPVNVGKSPTRVDGVDGADQVPIVSHHPPSLAHEKRVATFGALYPVLAAMLAHPGVLEGLTRG